MSIWEEPGGRPGSSGATGEHAQSPAADEGKPVELWCHEQRSTQVTLPWHSKRDLVKRNRCVPEKGKMGEKTSHRQKAIKCQSKDRAYLLCVFPYIYIYLYKFPLHFRNWKKGSQLERERKREK